MTDEPEQPTREQTLQHAAAAAHEINRVYCAAVGDYTQLPWETAPDWQRESVLAGVRAIAADPNLSHEASHQAWWDRKQREGWVYGEVKDPAKRTHPCCRPYAELPYTQRVKDAIFGAVVRGILNEHYVIAL